MGGTGSLTLYFNNAVIKCTQHMDIAKQSIKRRTVIIAPVVFNPQILTSLPVQKPGTLCFVS